MTAIEVAPLIKPPATRVVSDLRPNAKEAPALSFNPNLFQPGNYLLTLEGLTSQGRYVPVAKYPFRAIKK